MTRTLQLLAAGFGRAKARAEVYFEHAGGGKGASRYPSLRHKTKSYFVAHYSGILSEINPAPVELVETLKNSSAKVFFYDQNLY